MRFFIKHSLLLIQYLKKEIRDKLFIEFLFMLLKESNLKIHFDVLDILGKVSKETLTSEQLYLILVELESIFRNNSKYSSNVFSTLCNLSHNYSEEMFNQGILQVLIEQCALKDGKQTLGVFLNELVKFNTSFSSAIQSILNQASTIIYDSSLYSYLSAEACEALIKILISSLLDQTASERVKIKSGDAFVNFAIHSNTLTNSLIQLFEASKNPNIEKQTAENGILIILENLADRVDWNILISKDPIFLTMIDFAISKMYQSSAAMKLLKSFFKNPCAEYCFQVFVNQMKTLNLSDK